MSFDPEKITFFARTDARGKNVPFGIKARDRQRHMYVVGKTGMGKSTLLENMAAQDIQNGEGMAFIDPHGSAAELLLDYVPEHRVNDVVYFAPFDTDNPISFNVMEDVGPDKRHLVVSGLMSTFKKIWVDAWSSRMEYILTNALLVLIEYPDTTLLSVNRLFSDKAYRQKVVDHCQDPAVKSFWVDEFANYTERFAAEALPAIQNKVGQFTGNPLIRNVIGQPKSSFDLRKLMDERKIIIMNLSKGLIGETNANLLGSMLTTRLYLAAMSRADLPVQQMKQMPNFYFYVDEFQSFANATFADILSEARKYHLNLIIAHQYIEQMEEEVRNAVFGNVGTTVSFRVGPFDAETLETVFTPTFLAADLVNLGFAQIYLTLMIDGVGSQPFSASTLPPIEPPPVSCKHMVIGASRANFTSPRAEVEKIVHELHASQTPAMTGEKKPNNKGKKPNTGPGAPNTATSKPAGAPPAARKKPQSTDTPAATVSSAATTPKEPSVDDLKSVLAKIADDSAAKKPTKPPQAPAHNQSNQSNQSNQPNKTEPTKSSPEPNSNVPAKEKPSAKPVSRKPDTGGEKPAAKPNTEVSPLKAALAQALARTKVEESNTNEPAKESASDKQESQSAKPAAAKQPVAPVTPKPAPAEASPSAPESKSAENTDAELAALVAETEAELADYESRETSSKAADPLDPNAIKRMMRTSLHNKSPFEGS